MRQVSPAKSCRSKVIVTAKDDSDSKIQESSEKWNFRWLPGNFRVVLCCLTSEKYRVTSGKFTTSDHLSWVGGRSWDPCPKTADIHQKSTILPTTTMDDPTDPGSKFSMEVGSGRSASGLRHFWWVWVFLKIWRKIGKICIWVEVYSELTHGETSRSLSENLPEAEPLPSTNMSIESSTSKIPKSQ